MLVCKACAFPLPHIDHVEDTLQSNSFIIPAAQGAKHFRQFLVVLLIFANQPQLYIGVACDVEVSGTTSTTFFEVP